MLVEVGGVGVLVGMFHVLLVLARYFRLVVLWLIHNDGSIGRNNNLKDKVGDS